MSHIQSLLDEIHALEKKINEEIARETKGFGYTVNEGRGHFEAETVRQHKLLSKQLRQYFAECSLLELLVSPLVYSLIIPVLLFDLFIWFYQGVCFTVYGIPRVSRGDYIVLDRHRLKYLNPVERFNCLYCSYANGFLAFAQEVAARSEQYWCPIKHARQLKSTHARYNHFVSYGDAEGYVIKVQQLRNKLNDNDNR